jgi:ligand-binding sensor domain-containing protein/two-component sensor histidine kinase
MVAATCVVVIVLAPRLVRAGPARGLSGFSVTNWSETDGPLPYGVYDIAQDQEGFIWLAGRLGLVRFDGLSFVLWNDRVRLPKERISTIRIARDDSIWIGFAGSEGVARISSARETFTRYGRREGVAGGNVRTIYEDQSGTIWAGGYGGLSQFRDGAWNTLGEQSGLPTAPIISVYEDKLRALWVGTGTGVYRKSPGSSTFTLAAADLALGLAEDRNGVMWIADRQTLFKPINPATQSRASSDGSAGVGRGTALLVDRSGDLWIGTAGDGLIRRRVNSDFSAVAERFGRAHGLLPGFVHSVFQDRVGSIWVGTRGGLSRLTATSITPITASLDGVDDPFVYAALSSRDGALWLGTGQGAVRIVGEELRQYTEKDGLPGGVVTALHEDAAGTLWAATTSGMARLVGGQFSSITHQRNPLRVSSVDSFTVDRLGRLWMCDLRLGLLRWHDGRLDYLDRDLHRGPPNVAFTDHQGKVWIGYSGSGIDVYDGDVRTSYSTEQGLPAGSVLAIFEDSRHTIWVGSAFGIAVFDNAGHFQPLASSGIPEGSVTSIIEDTKHHLWFGLGPNLFRLRLADLDLATYRVPSAVPHRRFGPEDGLLLGLGRTGTPNAVLRPDGSLVFITASGPVSVRPDHLKPPIDSGPPRVESILADGREYTSPTQARLPPHTARIEVNYSTISLGPSAGLKFRYRLDGFDSDWQEAGKSRQAVYTSLPPGDYTFRLASSNGDELWEELDQPVRLGIDRTFYQTPVFYGLCAVVLSAAVAVGWHVRLRIIKERFSSVLAERVRVAQDLHDTLLQSLVAVALDFDDISSQLDSTADGLRDQVVKMREKVEHYIRETRLSIWQLRSPLLETGGLLEAVRSSGNLATSGSSTEFRCYEEGSPTAIAKDVEQQLLRIAQQAVMNAVRHADPDSISAVLSYGAEHVTLRVSDDGQGFDLDRVGTDGLDHWGLTTMRERAARIDATFSIVSQRGRGTTVEVVAPTAVRA